MGTTEGETTRRVAELVCETRFDRLPAEVVNYTKSLALSAVGGMVAGSVLPGCQIVTRYVQQMGGNPEATVVASRFRTSAESAAVANAFYCHTTEYEDDSMPEGVSAYTLFAAIFALSEKLRSPGSKVIEAFVAGQEVQSRMGIDCNNGRKRGYLNLSLTGVLGVGAAAARLLDLDVQRTTMALSLAASHAGGLSRQTGTQAHFFEMCIAARGGLAAGVLAADGLTGSASIFEGPKGFCDLMTAGQVTYPRDTIENWGKPYRTMEIGFKSFPCCYHNQRFIQGIIDMKAEHGFRAADVASVEIDVNPLIPQFIRYSDPRNADEARFSMPHGLAVALLDDRVTLASFSEERARDETVRELRSRIKMVVHEDWEWAALGGPFPIRVMLKDGTVLTRECDQVTGQPPDLLPVEKVVDKFRLLTGGLLAEERGEETIRLALGLDKLDNVARLMEAVAVAGD